MKLIIHRKDFFKLNIVSIAYLCMTFGALAHSLYATVYFYTGFTFLGIHSLCAIIMYVFFIITFKKHRLRSIFIGTNLELLSFIIFNAATFNWRHSFHLYIFVVIPLIIISSSSHSTHKYNIKVSVIQFIILCIAIFFTKIYTMNKPNLSNIHLNTKHEQIYDILSIFTFANALFCAFLLLLAFTHDLNTLLHASTHDSLTNLINRSGMNDNFNNALSDIKESECEYSIIIADLDDFKHINDTYGHNIGDEVLKSISQTLLDNVSSTDYVCRWGGEEFLILTCNNSDNATILAEKLRGSIETNIIHTEKTNIKITATFGVAQFFKDATLCETISNADKNLYKGKNLTKNCVIS